MIYVHMATIHISSVLSWDLCINQRQAYLLWLRMVLSVLLHCGCLFCVCSRAINLQNSKPWDAIIDFEMRMKSMEDRSTDGKVGGTQPVDFTPWLWGSQERLVRNEEQGYLTLHLMVTREGKQHPNPQLLTNWDACFILSTIPSCPRYCKESHRGKARSFSTAWLEVRPAAKDWGWGWGERIID